MLLALAELELPHPSMAEVRRRKMKEEKKSLEQRISLTLERAGVTECG